MSETPIAERTSDASRIETAVPKPIWSYEEYHPSYFKILRRGVEVKWFEHEDDARWVVDVLNSDVPGECHLCELRFTDLIGHYKAAHPKR